MSIMHAHRLHSSTACGAGNLERRRSCGLTSTSRRVDVPLQPVISRRVAHQARRCGSLRVKVAAAAPITSNVPLTVDPYEALKGKQVYLVSSQSPVELTSLWDPDQRAVLFWARTFGCPFCWELSIQLQRDVIPQLDAKGVKCFLTVIGTPERGIDFSAKTGFPQDRLLADPSSCTYSALGLKKGVVDTFFNPQTPLALTKRALAGNMGVLAKEVLPQWVPWQPPKQDQALNQGGVIVFEGSAATWAHYDPATSVHADLGEVVAAATKGL